MAKLWSMLRNGGEGKTEERFTLDDYAAMLQSSPYPIGFMNRGVSQKSEPPDDEFQTYIYQVYKSDGIVFACMQARQLIFSEARFQYQRMRLGRPGDLFGTNDLSILERPWPNGTTGELLTRAMQDTDLAGNFYAVRENSGRLRRLRPDWVQILLDVPPDEAVKSDIIGYLYMPGGPGSDPEHWEAYPIDGSNGQIAHWSPIPDPDAQYKGMSWITPVIREVFADKAATRHKGKFFENAPQPFDAKILTPTGWSTMGDMEIGSEVIGSDGRGHRVTDVLPQGIQDIYRVTFNDGTSAECTANHVWRVSNEYDRIRGVSRTMSLAEIMDAGIQYESGPYKWSVANTQPVEYVDQGELPLDPYVLGVLLGDGCFGGRSVSCATHSDDVDEWTDAFRTALPETVTVNCRERHGNGAEFQFARMPGSRRENWLKGMIRQLGLDNVLGDDKFVPEMYMRASIKDRLAVLQGLIDSDGHVSGAVVRFASRSEELARQVAELTMSLGGNATVTANLKGEWVTLVRRLPDWVVPCRLSRKVARYHPAQRVGAYRSIAKVQFVRCFEAQCIRVDVEDHLYVTDDYILTHNCTPNLAVSFKETVTAQQFKEFMELMDSTKGGIEHAYETLYLGGGADVTVVGANLKEMDFRETQGASETRIAAAARVHPVILGLSSALSGSSLNAGNYGSAKRQFADGTLRPLWRSISGALEAIVPVPSDARLWYDDRDISFLRQDLTELANIKATEARTISALVQDGYTPESVVKAVLQEDWSVLEHTGLFSVQLWPPGSAPGGPPGSAPDAATPPAPASPNGKATPQKAPAPKAATPKSMPPKKQPAG